MKRNFIVTICFLIFSIFLFTQTYAQEKQQHYSFDKLTPLSVKDSIELSSLPLLTLPESFKGPNAPLLPTVVDNSANIHWRPVFEQVQYECGQASAVGLGFTYAINRMRNLPSDVPENQYPTHFVWNFANDGEGYHGVSYFHSFEVLRTEGTPNVTTYGGMAAGGPSRWMTGYDNYYETMHNRLAEAFRINVSTPEGIETAKHWINNHLEGADVGGVANFYTSAPYGMPTLPAGTPEAGLYVVTSWGGANHGLTISGYHDSICWDYNYDGQYTNHIDINNDGQVDVRDWEIGGFRFANTYAGGPNWGNNGFSYMTYKSCADASGNGGIWNNEFHVQYAKAGIEPLLTARITLKHNIRNQIQVRMGYSADTTASYPEYIIGFPIFNFEGGNFYMQGGSSEEDKTIEFGLDITPIINMIGPGVPARYFLMVDEDDPYGSGTGQIINYSIIDYTDGVNEIICEQSNVNLVNNDLTMIWVNHTVNYEEVFVESDSLPAATVYEPYSTQLTATGGTEPYAWDFDLNFTETNYAQVMPIINDEQLNPSNNNDGYAIKQLDFDFPFYGTEYSEVKVYVDGYIMFENMLNWVYQVYDFLLFTKNKHIAPFMSDLRIYPAIDDGIWYEGNENTATFRWRVSVNGEQNTSELNFAVRLYKNGDIKYFFGEVNNYNDIEWLSGVSAGDNKYYQFTEVSNDHAIPPNYLCNLSSSRHPEGFEVSRSGIFNGTPMEVYNGYKIKFRVTDENNLTNSKALFFSTDGANYIVIEDYFVESGGNNVIEFGETANLSVDIKSLSEQTIYGVDMSITINDEYITLIDSTETLGDFEPGEIKTFESAFVFDVNNFVPDGHNIDFNSLIADNGGEEWASHIYLTAYAPEITIGSVGGSLDPGETADISVDLINNGGATANNIIATLSSNDPYITINSNTGNLNSLNPYSTGNVIYNITASDETPMSYVVEFAVDIEADNEYSAAGEAYLIIGLIYEGFETGDFSAYPWQFSGDQNWVIDENIVYEGAYSARSGVIYDNQNSIMLIEACFLTDDNINFYQKVSSEAGWDYLKFYIDGAEYGSWSGEQGWSESNYPVTAGVHTIKWAYEKDGSVSNGSDCGWVDNITFPPLADTDPQLAYYPAMFDKTLEVGDLITDTITLTNQGTGLLAYSIEVTDNLGNSINWLYIDPQTGLLNQGSSEDIVATFDMSDMEEGDYQAVITITDHIENEYLIPVWLHVDIGTGKTEINTLDRVNYSVPNPFNRETKIWFSLNKPASTTIEIFDFKGQKINKLMSSFPLDKGTHYVNWDATNNNGNTVEPGIYFYRITTGDEALIGKMILVN